MKNSWIKKLCLLGFLNASFLVANDSSTTENAFDFTITQSDINAGLIINQPGTWGLIESVNFSSTTAITITTTGVVLDLNNQTIDGKFMGANGIVVSHVDDLTIQNGTIINIRGSGIAISYTPYIELNKVVVTNAGNNGFSIDNSASIQISSCQANHGIGTGFFIADSVSHIMFTNCLASGNGMNGFSLASRGYRLVSCSVFNTASNEGAAFILSGYHGHLMACNASYNDGDGLQITGNKIYVQQSTITYNGGDGVIIALGSEKIGITANVISGNGGYGIANYGHIMNSCMQNKGRSNGKNCFGIHGAIVPN